MVVPRGKLAAAPKREKGSQIPDPWRSWDLLGGEGGDELNDSPANHKARTYSQSSTLKSKPKCPNRAGAVTVAVAFLSIPVALDFRPLVDSSNVLWRPASEPFERSFFSRHPRHHLFGHVNEIVSGDLRDHRSTLQGPDAKR